MSSSVCRIAPTPTRIPASTNQTHSSLSRGVSLQEFFHVTTATLPSNFYTLFFFPLSPSGRDQDRIILSPALGNGSGRNRAHLLRSISFSAFAVDLSIHKAPTVVPLSSLSPDYARWSQSPDDRDSAFASIMQKIFSLLSASALSR